MAVLSDPDRADVTADIMRELSNLREATGLNKIDLRAAVNAADVWADANAGSFNTTLPVAARTALTAAQKARLLMFVIRQRFVRA